MSRSLAAGHLIDFATMADFEVALAGYGLAGEVFHAPLISTTSGLHLRAIVTSDSERARRARLRYPGSLVIDRLEELFLAVPKLDVLVVASPNHLHRPQTVAALERGISVVVDKPMALSAGEAEEMIALASGRGLLLSPFQNRRWDDDFRLVQGLLRRDALGAIRRFESRFERWRPVVSPGSWREERSPEQGGGLLLDLGSHLLDQVLHLFGEPVAIRAELDRRRPGALSEDDCFVALEYPNGMHAHVWMSAVAQVAGPRFRVVGERATLVTQGLDPQEEQLRSGADPRAPRYGRRAPGWAQIADGDGGARQLTDLPRGAYPQYYREVAAALRGERAVPVRAEDGLAALRVIEAARQSARG